MLASGAKQRDSDANSQFIGKDPDAGKDWAQEEKAMTGMRGLDAITDSMDMSLSKLRETVKDRELFQGLLQFMGSQRVTHDLATEQQQIPYSPWSSWCPCNPFGTSLPSFDFALADVRPCQTELQETSGLSEESEENS